MRTEEKVFLMILPALVMKLLIGDFSSKGGTKNRMNHVISKIRILRGANIDSDH